MSDIFKIILDNGEGHAGGEGGQAGEQVEHAHDLEVVLEGDQAQPLEHFVGGRSAGGRLRQRLHLLRGQQMIEVASGGAEEVDARQEVGSGKDGEDDEADGAEVQTHVRDAHPDERVRHQQQEPDDEGEEGEEDRHQDVPETGRPARGVADEGPLVGGDEGGEHQQSHPRHVRPRGQTHDLEAQLRLSLQTIHVHALGHSARLQTC